MGLHSPQSAILSAIIFNALIIVALIPLALTGVTYRAAGAASLLRRNLVHLWARRHPGAFIGIKAIDLAVHRARIGLGGLNATHPPAIVMLVLMTVLTGLLYPLGFTALAQAVFPHQAAGSLVHDRRQGDWFGVDRADFAGAQYFHGRPSAAGNGYDAPILPAPTMRLLPKS